jgi:type IV fimbrial biogenesis protein FimT
MMVVISILAILAALALPSFRGLLERYRVLRASEDLTASIYLARTEAIRRGGSVVIQRTHPSGCTGDGSTTGRWDCGWIIFHDADGNGSLDAGELIQQSPPARGVTIKNSSDNNQMTLNRWGDLVPLGFGFEPAGPASTGSQRALCMYGGGRLKTVKGSTSCT